MESVFQGWGDWSTRPMQWDPFVCTTLRVSSSYLLTTFALDMYSTPSVNVVIVLLHNFFSVVCATRSIEQRFQLQVKSICGLSIDLSRCIIRIDVQHSRNYCVRIPLLGRKPYSPKHADKKNRLVEFCKCKYNFCYIYVSVLILTQTSSTTFDIDPNALDDDNCCWQIPSQLCLNEMQTHLWCIRSPLRILATIV